MLFTTFQGMTDSEVGLNVSVHCWGRINTYLNWRCSCTCRLSCWHRFRDGRVWKYRHKRVRPDEVVSVAACRQTGHQQREYTGRSSHLFTNHHNQHWSERRYVSCRTSVGHQFTDLQRRRHQHVPCAWVRSYQDSDFSGRWPQWCT